MTARMFHSPADPDAAWNLDTGIPIIVGGVSITPSIQVW